MDSASNLNAPKGSVPIKTLKNTALDYPKVKTASLCSLIFTQYRSVTDRQDRRTDGFAIAYTALALWCTIKSSAVLLH